MNRFKSYGITAAALLVAVGIGIAAGTQYPYHHSRWFGLGSKQNTEQFSINTPSAGASAVFTPGVTNTNALGSSSLRFSNIFSVLGSFSGNMIVTPPSTETISSAATITANGCGTIKRITNNTAVTTNTTDTFTAPASSNAGCFMYIVNVGTSTITLDNNAHFVSAGAADVAVTANDSVAVVSDGSAWYQISALLAN